MWVLFLILSHFSFSDGPQFDLSAVEQTPVFQRLNGEARETFEVVLRNHFQPAVTPQQWQMFSQKYLAYLQRETVSWSDFDRAIFGLLTLPDSSFVALFQQRQIDDLEVRVGRVAPSALQEACESPHIDHAVRAASCLSAYSFPQTPAIISNVIVDNMGGARSSALSSLVADLHVVFEAYRPETYTELIQLHEGFHTAMRLLGNLNRLARLEQWVSQSIYLNWQYDPMVQHHIDQLENESAPGLADIHVDRRFTSDHHGVIMTTLHHGLNQAVSAHDIYHPDPKSLRTDYPLNYLRSEQNWDDEQSAQFLEGLEQRLQWHLDHGDSMLISLGYLMEKIPAPASRVSSVF